MKEELNNIFAVRSPVSIIATVRKRLSPGRYELRDDAGNLLIAESVVSWSPGSRVKVEGGRIVAAGGALQTIKVYEV